MNTRRLPVLLAALGLTALAACTPMRWDKPNASPEVSQADLADCRNQASREAFQYSFAYGYGPFYMFGPRYRYSPFWRPYGFYGIADDRFYQENRLTNFCMRNKGYELVPAEQGA